MICRISLTKIFLILVSLFSLTSCSQEVTTAAKDLAAAKGAGQEKENGRVQLIVSAASSLTDALSEISMNYKAQNPDVIINFNFGSSGTLQKQIEQGAPVDVFFSAAEKQMSVLEKSGLILESTRVDLLGNRMVLVIPAGKIEPSSFDELNSASVKKLAMGEPASVPVGQYSKEVLTFFKVLTG